MVRALLFYGICFLKQDMSETVCATRRDIFYGFWLAAFWKDLFETHVQSHCVKEELLVSKTWPKDRL